VSRRARDARLLRRASPLPFNLDEDFETFLGAVPPDEPPELRPMRSAPSKLGTDEGIEDLLEQLDLERYERIAARFAPVAHHLGQAQPEQIVSSMATIREGDATTPASRVSQSPMQGLRGHGDPLLDSCRAPRNDAGPQVVATPLGHGDPLMSACRSPRGPME